MKLNKLAEIAEDHYMRVNEVHGDGSITVEVDWYNVDTKQSGVDYERVWTAPKLFKLLGY